MDNTELIPYVKQIIVLEQQNAAMLKALKLVSHAHPTKYVYADSTDTPFIISKNILEKVEQAIALVEGDE